MKTPNKATGKAMEDVRARRNLTHAKDADDMIRQLHMPALKIAPTLEHDDAPEISNG